MIKPIKNKVIDKVSDVMSYPARRTAQKSILRSDQDFKKTKMVNVVNRAKQSLQQKSFQRGKSISSSPQVLQKGALQALRKNSR